MNVWTLAYMYCSTSNVLHIPNKIWKLAEASAAVCIHVDLCRAVHPTGLYIHRNVHGQGSFKLLRSVVRQRFVTISPFNKLLKV